MIFIFHFVHVVHHTNWFVRYIPGINPTWPWCMIFLTYLWFIFANILLRNFPSVFIRDILFFFFFVTSFSGFRFRVMLVFSNELGSLYSLRIICNSLRHMCYFFEYVLKFTCEAIQSRTFVHWVFFGYWFHLITSY